MTHMAPISNADLELVSAYLDNQLAPDERTILEVRFAEDAALRQTCEELGATVLLLRELAPVRPPRSFTLDPAMVAPQRSWQLPATWMRLGSAFATLLFAITFAFGPTGGAPTANAPAASSARSMPDSATGGSTAVEGVTAAPAMAAEATAAPAAESAPMAATAATADPAAMIAAAAPEDASTTQSVITDTTTSSPDTTTIGVMQSKPPREVVPPPSGLTVVQIALAVLALGLLLGSFRIGRRMR